MIDNDNINRYYGIYRGVVKTAIDPTGQHRIKLQVPQIHGDAVTNWAWPVYPAGVTTSTPVVGQGVWVLFVGGDPEFPLWMGEFGTHKDASKKVYINPLSNSTSLSTISAYVVTENETDGTISVDLMQSLVAMADHVNSLQDEVNSIESNVGTSITTSSGWIGSFNTSTVTWNSLKDRIANIEYGLYSVYSGTAGGTSVNTLNPFLLAGC